MPMRLPRILAEPDAILRVHDAAARAEALVGVSKSVTCRSSRRCGRCVAADVGEPGVVLRIRDHVVDVVPDRRVLERLPGLPLAGLEIDAVHAGKAVVLRPHLAVDAMLSGLVMLTCVLGRFHSARERPDLELLGLGVELADRAPGTSCRARGSRRDRARRASAPGGEAFLFSGDRDFGQLAGLRVELAEILLAEVEYQTVPSESTTTSCGWIVGRGRSHSVMMTRVRGPWDAEGLQLDRSSSRLALWLIVARYSACAR